MRYLINPVLSLLLATLWLAAPLAITPNLSHATPDIPAHASSSGAGGVPGPLCIPFIGCF